MTAPAWKYPCIVCGGCTAKEMVFAQFEVEDEKVWVCHLCMKERKNIDQRLREHIEWERNYISNTRKPHWATRRGANLFRMESRQQEGRQGIARADEGGIVILYHFTRRVLLESIREQGLVPKSSLAFEADIDIPTPPNFPIVWLIQKVQTASDVFAPAVKDMSRRRDVRITIKLPVKTKSLWHWPTWLEQYDPEYLQLLQADDPNLGWPWAYYWFSTAVITPDRFRSIDADASPVVEITEEQRQVMLARLARQQRLIDSMLGVDRDSNVSSRPVSRRALRKFRF